MRSSGNHNIPEIPLLLYATATELWVPKGPSLYGEGVKPDISDFL